MGSAGDGETRGCGNIAPLELSRAEGGAPVALCGIFSGTRLGSTKSATSSIRLPREDALSVSWCLYANVPGSSSVEASEDAGVV